MLIYFFTLFLFLPALSSALTRRILLVSLFLAAFLWAFEIQGRLNTLGVISSHITFLGKGNDKNYISLCLALAATMLAALVVLWKPSGKLPTWFVSVLKVILVLGSGYFVYALFLTYSRSGLFTALVGYCVVIGLLLKQRYGLLRLLVAVGILALFIGFYAEDLLEQAPGWIGYFETSQFQTRLSLIQKALAIIQDNPLLGIGPDESAQRYTEYREANLIGLPHNSFLKGWAEEGIAGLMGYLIWLIAFLILLKNHFSVATLGDQIWLCLMIPYFFMMMLLDLGGNAWFMLALLCGIYGDLGHGQSDLPHIIA
jgi:O-antigen ligase